MAILTRRGPAKDDPQKRKNRKKNAPKMLTKKHLRQITGAF
jgi:hypothetical protein